MTIRKLALTFLLLVAAFQAHAASDDINIAFNVDLKAGLDVTYNSSTGVYDFQTTATTPMIYTVGLSTDAPSDYVTLEFEYTSEGTNQVLQIWYGNAFANDRQTYYPALAVKSDWTTYTINIQTDRTNYSWGKAGEMLMFHFQGMATGTKFKIRNLRLKSPVQAFKPHTITPGTSTKIEAEDYNIGGNGTSYGARQYVNINSATYSNPAGDHLPILAWGSIPASLSTTERFKELADCGFNISLQHFSLKGEIETALKNAQGTGVSIIPEFWGTSQVDDCVNWFLDEPNFAGWFIGDEPFSSKFAQYGALVERIRAAGSKKLNYCNLYHSDTDVSALGTKSYVDYVQRYVREVGTGFISFDNYPVYIPNGSETETIKDFFFENLELVSMVAKQYDIPFWAFARSIGSTPKVTTIANYPTPTLKGLRYQIFNDLAYGAQGIQYYSYCMQWDSQTEYHDGPLNSAYEKTPIWYLVQSVNKEVLGLEKVFYGAKVNKVYHSGTSSTIPKGTTLLPTNYFADSKFNSITTNGQGLLFSDFENGNNSYLMVLNRDYDNDQVVTVDVAKELYLVKNDSTTEKLEVGKHEYTLTPADYLIFLTATKTSVADEPNKIQKIYKPDTTYRTDTEGVDIVAIGDGNYMLRDMGESWSQYTLGLYSQTASPTISWANALENWGSWYCYDVTVEKDMDVDISFRTAVPWSEYAAAKSQTTNPYRILRKVASLNYTKQYVASMMLYIDDAVVTSAQTTRPAFNADPTVYEQGLADKSTWVSTLGTKTSNDTVFFWPRETSGEPVLANETAPQYANVHLTAGTHRIKVQSLCSPWNFDSFTISEHGTTAVTDINADNFQLKAQGKDGAIAVQSTAEAKVYTLTGSLVANVTNGTIEVPAGIYIVAAKNQSVKVIVK